MVDQGLVTSKQVVGQGPSMVVYAENPGLLAKLVEEARLAGFFAESKVATDEAWDDLTTETADFVLLQIDHLNPERCRQLEDFDRKIGGDGQQLIVSATLDVLDQLYSCINDSNAQIVIAATSTERVLALARLSFEWRESHRERSFDAGDRQRLKQISEQIEEIFARLPNDEVRPNLPESEKFDNALSTHQKLRAPGLPDPALVRSILKLRRMRDRFFDPRLFGEPAWDILLDLCLAKAEGLKVSITSVCIAAAVPPTTALRWVRDMTDAGLLQRVDDPLDKRRSFIELSQAGSAKMSQYFQALARD